MRSVVVKLTTFEADKLFPFADENATMPAAPMIESSLLHGVWREVVVNTGEQEVKEFGEPTLYDMHTKITTDQHGDDIVPVADYTATMEDGQQLKIQFVCLM